MHDEIIKDALARLASEIPDRSGIPPEVLRKARRRVVRNLLLVGAAVATGIAMTSMAIRGLDAAKPEAPVRPAGTAEDDMPPRSAPTGRVLVSGADARDTDLFMIDLDAGEIDQVTSNDLLEESPSWAPVGDAFAYQAYRGEHPTSGDAIFVSEGGNVRQLVDLGISDAHPDWAPNGKQIAFDSSDGAIHVVDTDGSNLREVVRGEFPAWSPDGSRLAFISADSIHIAAAGGGQATKVEGSEGAADVDWSPDGTRLAFSTYDGSTGEIYTIPLAGGRPRAVVVSDAPERSPSWSPDGMWIAAVRVVNHRARIVALSTMQDDALLTLTPAGKDYFEPDWGPAAPR